MQVADEEWAAAYMHHAPPPFEYDMHNTMSNNNTHIVLFKYCDG
jgi:hypothetical protein